MNAHEAPQQLLDKKEFVSGSDGDIHFSDPSDPRRKISRDIICTHPECNCVRDSKSGREWITVDADKRHEIVKRHGWTKWPCPTHRQSKA